MDHENDDVDKWPFRRSKQKSAEKKSFKGVTILGNVDSNEYCMDYPNMGKCIIFNHEKFLKLKERKGTDHDVQSLYCQLKRFGFKEIIIFSDLEVREVMEKLDEVRKQDHSKNSCFVCCVLTHGDEGMLWAKDGIYPIESLYEPFRGDCCSTLVGKPKIFFIQACQGKVVDSGIDAVCESIDGDTKFKIPVYADILIALSTFPGFVSFRSGKYGSYFIQTLCEVLKKHAKDTHLMDMLTIVCREIALNFESSNIYDLSIHKKKQIPVVKSTLTRFVKFPCV